MDANKTMIVEVPFKGYTYKYCIVPMCRSTTVKAPEKIFFHMPHDAFKRKKWCFAMRRCPIRNKELSVNSHRYVCEDHFDLEKDMKNYIRYKLQNVKALLHPGVVPHKFECQKSKKTTDIARNNKLFQVKRPSPAPAAQAIQPNFEPEVVIKEEPIDIDEDPIPSTSRSDHEFILPCSEPGQLSSTPTVGEAFSVVKTEPVEDEPQTTSNGNCTKASKKRKADVSEQSESPSMRPEEDSATKNNNAKDHFDVYGEYIAAKLRKLDWKSCAYVQKAFGDILFDAEMGKFK